MNDFLIGVLVGLACFIVLFPLGLWIYSFIRNTKERRKIKGMLKRGEFLTPLDEKDYNSKVWQNQRYGNINPEEHKEALKNLDIKIFNRNKRKKLEEVKVKEEPREEPKKEVKSNFKERIDDYVKQARQLGYDDDQIKDEFKRMGYTEDIIREALDVEW